MGKEKTTTRSTQDTQTENQQSTTQSQQATATAAEVAQNAREADELGATSDVAQQGQFGAFNLINALLTGGSLPGFLGGLPGGISPEAIGTQASRVASQAQPGFQSLGIADSGVAFRETAQDVAENVLFPAEQFNISNLFNLLQTGLSGQSSLQGQRIAQQGNLGARLAGLRSITGSSTGQFSGTTSSQGQTTVSAPNPFLSEFQKSLGNSLGSGSFGSSPFGSSGAGAAGGASGGGGAAAAGCWVAAEIFGGWDEPKTCAARHYVNNLAPKWFKKFYLRHGETIAEFISNKPILKAMLKPMFEYFAVRGKLSLSF
jgi:hypothetical protein